MSVEELVKKLRRAVSMHPPLLGSPMMEQAADKLEELAADERRYLGLLEQYANRITRDRAALAEKNKEIAALREALEMISRIDLSHLSECRDIARAALAQGADDECG